MRDFFFYTQIDLTEQSAPVLLKLIKKFKTQCGFKKGTIQYSSLVRIQKQLEVKIKEWGTKTQE